MYFIVNPETIENIKNRKCNLVISIYVKWALIPVLYTWILILIYQAADFCQLRPKSGSEHTAVQCTEHTVHVYFSNQVSVYSSFSRVLLIQEGGRNIWFNFFYVCTVCTTLISLDQREYKDTEL